LHDVLDLLAVIDAILELFADLMKSAEAVFRHINYIHTSWHFTKVLRSRLQRMRSVNSGGSDKRVMLGGMGHARSEERVDMFGKNRD
jgi:hypothetical protein